MDKRIFWAVLAALLVFSALGFFFLVGLGSAASYVADQQVQQLQQQFAKGDEKIRRETEARRYQAAVARQRDIASRTLSPSQRCFGGTVVDVVPGSSYVQHVDVRHRPVKCSGRLADEPLR